MKRLFLRFIPTCVGKWPASPGAAAFPPVHPHVRGEMLDMLGMLDAHGGSSPRAWGNGGGDGQGSARIRFIPTCVGK